MRPWRFSLLSARPAGISDFAFVSYILLSESQKNGDGILKRKLVFKWIRIVLVGLLVCFTSLLVGLKLFGLKSYVVLSGSMEPKYSVGELIYVKDTKAEEVGVGDIIVFPFGDAVATHRIVGVNEDAMYFRTKGDANSYTDASPVYFDEIIGIPVFSIPLVGYVSLAVQSPWGIAAVAILCILLLLWDEIAKWLMKKRSKTLREHEGHQG